MAVLSLASVKSHLNITGEQHDTELQAMLDAAVAAIGERVGPLEPVERTVRVRSTGYGLRVPGPVASITSISDMYETTLTIADLYLDADPGLVSYADGRAVPAGHYLVTYMAGRDPVPADLLLAAKELVRHFWNTQRGPTRRPGSAPSESAANSVPGAAYLLPFRVSELLKPHMPIHVGV
ncbi:phage gp6-like head-tail connector protein [Nocardioides KLBMP 9356]|uniref:Phage gp6-like head-tail connector protein n=1 Tax=Nocardioides potassii TaxID=2911371 RepID=A0ABS9H9H2_9ACTN|nr:head-tail connector protein [Nocardioides potassii]MCF6376902.1 phage gp6-like head-tail connector protein [Nocardioides potassii]